MNQQQQEQQQQWQQQQQQEQQQQQQQQQQHQQHHRHKRQTSDGKAVATVNEFCDEDPLPSAGIPQNGEILNQEPTQPTNRKQAQQEQQRPCSMLEGFFDRGDDANASQLQQQVCTLEHGPNSLPMVAFAEETYADDSVRDGGGGGVSEVVSQTSDEDYRSRYVTPCVRCCLDDHRRVLNPNVLSSLNCAYMACIATLVLENHGQDQRHEEIVEVGWFGKFWKPRSTRSMTLRLSLQFNIMLRVRGKNTRNLA